MVVRRGDVSYKLSAFRVQSLVTVTIAQQGLPFVVFSPNSHKRVTSNRAGVKKDAISVLTSLNMSTLKKLGALMVEDIFFTPATKTVE